MIEFYNKEDGNKNLILFVHGFTGDSGTWKHLDHESFPDLLIKDEKIRDNYDVAGFEYFTKLTNLFATTNKASKLVQRMLKISHQKLKKISVSMKYLTF